MDSERKTSKTRLKSFEGMWLMTRPSGAIACAQFVNGKLLIPYSFGDQGKLTGHYYDCRVVGETLLSRFEQFDSAVSGVLFLNPGANETLKGGRWSGNKVPQTILKGVAGLFELFSAMEPTVWVWMQQKERPEWAERYFREDWPNKDVTDPE
jgi:hypothetical protein